MNMNEVLKLALEALETVAADVKTTPTAYEAQRQAITALREALVNEALDKKAENAREIGLDYEPVQQEPAGSVYRYGKDSSGKQWHGIRWTASGLDLPDGTLIYTSPPQQEPVAYDKTEINCFAQDLYDQKMREGKRGHYESMFHVIHQCIKKVSPTAQRTWIGLTDEEIVRIASTPCAVVGSYVHTFARAIEAKLQEKNT